MNDKTVLITGATSGIGKATAIALARKNYKIIIHGRDKQKTEQTCGEIQEITGNSKIDLLIADLSLLKEVQNLADEFTKKYDRLDILINNAGGIMNKKRELTDEGIEKTMAINLLAPFLLTKLLLPLLSKSPDGRIINVSSNSHSLNANPNFDDLQLTENYSPLRAYGNAKLFLIWISQHLSASLKSEHINNLTINTMHPGAIASNFGLESNLGSFLNLLAKLARPLLKTVEQGADTIIYLAHSKEVQNISGAYFVNRKKAKVTNKYHSIKNEKLIWDYCEIQIKKNTDEF
jgi:NAD(P)-dependent dehydrogenase (short-subunit alcohol dehydrogenase family)